MKLNVESAIRMLRALESLDCYTRVVKDGSKETAVVVPMKISAGVLMDIATNIAKLKTVEAAYLAARNAKLKELSPATMRIDPEKQPDLVGPFQMADREMLDKETDELDLKTIKKGDLLRDDNQVTGSALAALLPILGD